ncbi:MAG: polyprenyl synthetase family protein [Chloroflexota bacterium]|nr:polyprenyl synthetase family protein [Chloroflexota bacterium]MDQ5864200.1 polyprenyl synthetase family protein [Chloroflexota bacterium]
MKVISAGPAPELDGRTLEERFDAALRERRDRVYEYLDTWPGSAKFKPQDIHDALFTYLQRRGKALRPLLVLLCCGAVGGNEDQALPAAAAVEVFHTWTLVHDDIIDRDDTRRGRPTVHAMYRDHARSEHGHDEPDAAHYGTSVAILAGDLQQAWTYGLLADLANRGVALPLVLELIDRMAGHLTPGLLEGEMLDVQYSLMPAEELDEERILHMLTMKTGTLLEYAAWCGAKIGLGGAPDPHGLPAKLGRFASLCGTAFQLHDDLLGLTADESRLGKPVGSDIREGKRTLIVYKALSRASQAERRVLLSTLGKSDASPSEVEQVLAILHSTGACAEVAGLARGFVDQALTLLDSVPHNEYRELLRSWALFLLARES